MEKFKKYFKNINFKIQKKIQKKFNKKIILNKNFRIYFPIYFVFRDSTSNLGSACENLGGLGPAGLAVKGIRTNSSKSLGQIFCQNYSQIAQLRSGISQMFFLIRK
jgi:hypothetical protein